MAIFIHRSLLVTLLVVFSTLLHTTTAVHIPARNDDVSQQSLSLDSECLALNESLSDDFSGQFGDGFSPISTGWCCLSGDVCDGNTGCKESTATWFIHETKTLFLYNYRTTILSVAATTTKTEVVSRITVITVSSAAMVTAGDTKTISTIAKRAPTVARNNPANIPNQPKETFLLSSRTAKPKLQQSVHVPITPKPTTTKHRCVHKEKRIVTSTVVFDTVTTTITSAVELTSVVSYISTETSLTTEWQTSTTKVIDETRTTGGGSQQTPIDDEITLGNSSRGGLSKDAQIGIGVGVGILAISAAIFLVIFLRRRRAQKSPANQAMINDAVAAPMAANSSQSPHDKMPPTAPSPIPYGTTSTAFYTPGAPPGSGQHGFYRQEAPVVDYQGYSPGLSASPVQQPFGRPRQTEPSPPYDYPVLDSR
ncbi:uncharacterized protein K460DRAFT_431295 [Cucurbitaria berberidis CBS 394.84]|uniref:Mid2 domain-containing protein n=1 Tax=Cucurbitaria berberidis CBS 394.84 TaxID=1168544 RepID=A0A9P4GIK6_9PLEO|nr:uncharacterized protein K460DRAFT_431295 [Cucurbitaria berberidis CBS 394.84]KAF1846255.1 hypothetical protein K460DRAFT_431295 [Cucurbitaria berberidis CBS 394.84]